MQAVGNQRIFEFQQRLRQLSHAVARSGIGNGQVELSRLGFDQLFERIPFGGRFGEVCRHRSSECFRSMRLR